MSASENVILPSTRRAQASRKMSLGSSVKVSYLIAVKNKVATIARCLSSILDQDVDEVIVVDGRSTDGTTEVVRKFPVTHLLDAGSGLATARNLGFKRCTGDYLVIVDGDQRIQAGFDRKLKILLESTPYDAVFCKEIWAGPSVWAKAHREAWGWVSYLRYHRIYRPKVYKKSVVSAAGGWNEVFTSFEDADIWQRIKEKSPTILYSDLKIYSDTSSLSPMVQFKRGVWYGSKLITYLKYYPSELEHITSVAPIGFLPALFLALLVFIRTRDIKLVLAALSLRIAESVGWFVGLLSTKQV